VTQEYISYEDGGFPDDIDLQHITPGTTLTFWWYSDLQPDFPSGAIQYGGPYGDYLNLVGGPGGPFTAPLWSGTSIDDTDVAAMTSFEVGGISAVNPYGYRSDVNASGWHTRCTVYWANSGATTGTITLTLGSASVTVAHGMGSATVDCFDSTAPTLQVTNNTDADLGFVEVQPSVMEGLQTTSGPPPPTVHPALARLPGAGTDPVTGASWGPALP